MEGFCNGIRAIIKSHPKTRKDYYEIHFSGYGDFSLKIMLYFFMKVTSWTEELRVRHEIYLDILRLAKEMNVRFAFPTQTLHVESMAEASAIKIPAPLSSEILAEKAHEFSEGGKFHKDSGPRVGEPYYAGDK
jgi:MscS family membrane protein